MQWISSRRHGAELEDTDPVLEAPRRERIRRAAAIGGAVLLTAVAVVAILGIPRSFFRDLFIEPPGPALERPADRSFDRVLDPDELPSVESARTVLADTETVWSQLLGSYSPPRLGVVEGGGVESACGSSSNGGAPFYCATDRKVYVDTAFLGELGERFGRNADFAQAYVVAHAVGHHLQALSGLTERIEAQRVASGEPERSQLTMRQELQADCYAGVWAHHSRMRGRIAGEDIDAGLEAAATVGNERALRGGLVVPESFTHGTTGQRSQWFRRGFDGGSVDDCNAFEVVRL